MVSVMVPYRGLSFPMRIGPTGKFEVSETGTYDINHIIESVQQIVATRIGERYILRNFGSELPPVLFESMNDSLRQLIKSLVYRALSKWEPRVVLRRVDIVNFDTDRGLVNVEMDIFVIKLQKIVTLTASVVR